MAILSGGAALNELLHQKCCYLTIDLLTPLVFVLLSLLAARGKLSGTIGEKNRSIL